MKWRKPTVSTKGTKGQLSKNAGLKPSSFQSDNEAIISGCSKRMKEEKKNSTRKRRRYLSKANERNTRGNPTEMKKRKKNEWVPETQKKNTRHPSFDVNTYDSLTEYSSDF